MISIKYTSWRFRKIFGEFFINDTFFFFHYQSKIDLTNILITRKRIIVVSMRINTLTTIDVV